ncbi:MAG TPA: hypothetical protein VGL60_12205 [Acidimicrobiales bacterium]|jgi:8-oxo-dGTP pyrophosphatase MutT (NUDIX family)
MARPSLPVREPGAEPPATGLPVVPRPAATLLVVRDRPAPAARPGEADRVADTVVSGGLEVLMVRRSERADFVGGAHVFPGGGVDPTDDVATAGPEVAALSDEVASAVLGLAPGGRAYWVAALRECFEEAGVLLAYRGSGRSAMLSFERDEERARYEDLRREVNAGRLSFLDLCRGEGLQLALDRVHYFAHWVTPAGSPRRYDTRFFVTLAPHGQSPRRDDREIVDEVWISPEEALRRHRAGEIDVVLPTARCLSAISGFPSAGALVEAVRRAGGAGAAEVAGHERGAEPPRPSGPPLMVRDFHGARVVLPGDPPGAAGLPPRLR